MTPKQYLEQMDFEHNEHGVYICKNGEHHLFNLATVLEDYLEENVKELKEEIEFHKQQLNMYSI